jgi:hypothetical protein
MHFCSQAIRNQPTTAHEIEGMATIQGAPRPDGNFERLLQRRVAGDRRPSSFEMGDSCSTRRKSRAALKTFQLSYLPHTHK